MISKLLFSCIFFYKMNNYLRIITSKNICLYTLVIYIYLIYIGFYDFLYFYCKMLLCYHNIEKTK